ncbi:MAG: 16S rRNA (guanine(966)-N(2))-methyltransferase RsmD [Nocardioidaceae bacterium]
MTRIIAGQAGGRRIATPAGDDTRPTTDRVREALFSVLESQLGGWSDVRVLDLFAGSGALGLEALSRGAAHATFVEQDRRTADVVRRNIATLGLAGATVVAAPAARAVARLDGAFDVVFMDPPYAFGDDELTGVQAALGDRGAIAADGIVVVERSKRSGEPVWAGGLEATRHKTYGSTTLWYGRRHA